MKENKKIARLAKRIASLEKKLYSGVNTEEVAAEIEEITRSLSVEEMIKVDEYIIEKKLLTT